MSRFEVLKCYSADFLSFERHIWKHGRETSKWMDLPWVRASAASTRTSTGRQKRAAAILTGSQVWRRSLWLWRSDVDSHPSASTFIQWEEGGGGERGRPSLVSSMTCPTFAAGIYQLWEFQRRWGKGSRIRKFSLFHFLKTKEGSLSRLHFFLAGCYINVEQRVKQTTQCMFCYWDR